MGPEKVSSAKPLAGFPKRTPARDKLTKYVYGLLIHPPFLCEKVQMRCHGGHHILWSFLYGKIYYRAVSRTEMSAVLTDQSRSRSDIKKVIIDKRSIARARQLIAKSRSF